MSELFLTIFMYCIIGISVIFYAVLDGFDLGVGALHLLAKDDTDRRMFLNAIGPVWDGNEVWLVIVLGALLAAFTPVYATLLSSFYVLVMFLLACLIFRAVAIEFRSKQASPRWRKTWDAIFSLASAFIGFIVGVILGNLIVGIPIDEYGDYLGGFWNLFTPYPLLVGVMTLSLFMMHGAIYLVMKTEGELHDRVRGWINPCIIFFICSYLLVTIATLVYQPHMTETLRKFPYLFIIPAVALLAILNVPREVSKGNDGRSFVFSCIGVALLLAIYALGTFPTIVRSSIDPIENSITIFNSASSHLTLKVLFIIVIIGIPLVLSYGFLIYRIFRGKVKLGPTSY